MLLVERIGKKIEEEYLLKEISLTVKKKSISVIVWPSWSWKSLLLECIAGISSIEQGKIYDTNKSKEKSSILLVWQNTVLWPHMNIQQNILLPLIKNNLYDDSAYKKILKKLWITTLINRFPYECSGGERQRVCLARALLFQPRYLLLDEVTSAQDIENIQIILDLLNIYKSRCGILLVTHHLSFAKKLGDKIYFLDKWIMIESWDSIIRKKPQTQRFRDFLSVY